jgi:hypothetical protein
MFSVTEFLKYCTLTTPIGHYRIQMDIGGNMKAPVKSNASISEEMILDIWNKYREWKPEQLHTINGS